ncbi:MAG: DUF4886 domain-containing protein [Burkholderiaceae bacterium]
MTTQVQYQKRTKFTNSPGKMALLALVACAIVWAPAAYSEKAGPAPTVTAPQVDNPSHLLFVGNSYLYYGDSLHNHVRRMLLAGDKSINSKNLKYKSATISGSKLLHHDIDHLTKPGNIGVKEPFQLVILQGGSTAPLSEKRSAEFRSAAKQFAKTIDERGGKTALYMTHAYVAPHKKAKPENFALTRDLYVSVGNEIGALVIPVGQAFEDAYRKKPGIVLHKDFDGSHPSLYGTYLAASTVYASVYNRSPVGNPYDYFGKIEPEMKNFLQQVAADTVTKFYGKSLATK